MVVAILTETFAPYMGYIQNCLPKYLARLGAEVHVITGGLLPGFRLPDFDETYTQFHRSWDLRPGVVQDLDGFSVHVLQHEFVLGRVRLRGLRQKLAEIRPDVVQCFAAIGWLPLDCALARPRCRFVLFTGNHHAASHFPLARNGPHSVRPRIKSFLCRFLPGRLISLFTTRCYAVTSDCGEIAWRFFGVPREKVEVVHLGVDTEIFHPVMSPGELEQRYATRRELGFSEHDIVCVYTGKFSESKDPRILGEAVGRLTEMGKPYRSLFIGDGRQAAALKTLRGSVVLSFLPFGDLARYYRAADIAVWPSDESTSMLDAAGCGLPLVISDLVAYREHIEGNGLVFRYGDEADLRSTLIALEDPEKRQGLGRAGARKMAQGWSWSARAARRLSDYEQAVKRLTPCQAATASSNTASMGGDAFRDSA